MKITAERLREVAEYDPQTGRMAWKVKTGKKCVVGQEMGGLKQDGYRHVQIEGEQALVHRLAWLYMTGEWPMNDVDHINGVRSDNRWANLRDVTRSINLQNRRKAGTRSKSGRLGVRANGSGWSAQIKEPGLEGRRLHLGTFKTIGEAAEAYLSAKRALHPGNTL